MVTLTRVYILRQCTFLQRLLNHFHSFKGTLQIGVGITLFHLFLKNINKTVFRFREEATTHHGSLSTSPSCHCMFYVSFIGFSEGRNTDKNALKESQGICRCSEIKCAAPHLFWIVRMTRVDPPQFLRLPSEECFELLNTRQFPGGVSLMNQTKTFKCFVPRVVLQ